MDCSADITAKGSSDIKSARLSSTAPGPRNAMLVRNNLTRRRLKGRQTVAAKSYRRSETSLSSLGLPCGNQQRLLMLQQRW